MKEELEIVADRVIYINPRIIEIERGGKCVVLESKDGMMTQIELVKNDIGHKTRSLVISRKTFFNRRREIDIFSLFGEIGATSNRNTLLKFLLEFLFKIPRKEERISDRFEQCSDLSKKEISNKETNLSIMLECENLNELVKTIRKNPKTFLEIFNRLFECFWK